jgi:hypothetical protein
MNVRSACHLIRTSVTGLLVHIRQKEKIAPEIAAGKLASVNLFWQVLKTVQTK